MVNQYVLNAMKDIIQIQMGYAKNATIGTFLEEDVMFAQLMRLNMIDVGVIVGMLKLAIQNVLVVLLDVQNVLMIIKQEPLSA